VLNGADSPLVVDQIWTSARFIYSGVSLRRISELSHHATPFPLLLIPIRIPILFYLLSDRSLRCSAMADLSPLAFDRQPERSLASYAAGASTTTTKHKTADKTEEVTIQTVRARVRL
jgi:hypothetical protein